jgi:tRNA threonylcarbamoyladenosine biosynthesis protein TsaB
MLAASGERWLAVGDGVLAYRAAIDGSGARAPDADSSLHRVSAIEVCRLALTVQAGSADAVVPDYLREPDALPGRARVHAR